MRTYNYSEKEAKIFKRYADANPLLDNANLARLIHGKEKLPLGNLRHKITKWKEDCKTINTNFDFENTNEPVFNMPESWHESIEPFVIPLNIQRMALFGDIHVPFHDIAALRTALNYSKNYGVDAVLLTGDAADEYSKSRFAKEPDLVRPDMERSLMIKFLTSLRKFFPNIPIYYKLGNHELRLEKYLNEKSPELARADELQYHNWMKFADNNITNLGGFARVEFGKLNIWHGHELGLHGGINIARTLLLRTMTNSVIGHVHKTQSFTKRKPDNKTITAWTIGCLCGIDPKYMSVNEWNHGFAIAERTDDKGGFILHNKMIINGVVR